MPCFCQWSAHNFFSSCSGTCWLPDKPMEKSYASSGFRSDSHIWYAYGSVPWLNLKPISSYTIGTLTMNGLPRSNQQRIDKRSNCTQTQTRNKRCRRYGGYCDNCLVIPRPRDQDVARDNDAELSVITVFILKSSQSCIPMIMSCLITHHW